MKKAIQIPYNDLFEQKCIFAAEAGFRYISVNFAELVGKSEYEWEKITEDIMRILDKTGLKCIQSHPYYYDLRISSEIIKDECEFAIMQAIAASGKLGASWCAIHPRSSITSGFRTSESFHDNKKYFSKYLEHAVKHGTGIAAENLPVFGNIKPVMPFYSSNYYDLCDFVDSFNDENLQICWDFGHANMMHFDMADAICFMGKRIKCTHVHNNFGWDDQHLPIDSGNIKWKEVMLALASVGYDGALTLETQCCYTDTDILQSFARHNFAGLEFIEKYAVRR